ncbi:Holliday junction endonuclease [Thermosynechococcaceae cyanobacterium BACA0444]|uniref:Holliday junction endonuclease n=1 Tax=Pseudocalidococcus azoricus BACA0444 TaxID=2918990 RepID=A0AAE4JVL0_9CYAN|nr:Holliday junction endonuclease [Pseudocalidococcus azoricus]MDS3860156.1 Holliday junction endonuclease [Pseudocalidococcus azoricus BACA0444]
MNLAAVDPGLSGGLAILHGGNVIAKPLPIAGKDLDLATLAQWLKESNPGLVVVEKVHSMPGQGVASMFTFGKGFGAILGIAAALNISVELVTPQAWKKVVLAGSQKDKNAAIDYCRRAFPQVSLLPGPRCRKPHDGMADALCLLEYGRRVFSETR